MLVNENVAAQRESALRQIEQSSYAREVQILDAFKLTAGLCNYTEEPHDAIHYPSRLNILNLALIDENDQMRARVEAIQERNANLVERQQNMEEMIVAGQTLQAAEASATGIRVLSNGRQRDTDRASRTSMVKVCFTLLENRIAESGTKTLHLQVVNEAGEVLAGEQTERTTASGTPISATRQVDYNNDRVEACIFYIPEGSLSEGAYVIQLLEGDEAIGNAQLVLN